ncbi:GroES-like protein [Backusella circina FSU 941]|nr:GroES-like protein [Backusella circina FSU 941]
MSNNTSNNTSTAWTSFGKGEPLKLTKMPLKTWEEDDVEIQITECGICGTDIHTLDSNWGPTDYPCVAGHEIAGHIIRVGQNVANFKVGDRAGLGPMVDSCGECEACQDGIINICEGGYFGTYNSHWRNGEKTYGGFADKWRGNSKFVIKIPDNISNEAACTMFCGGITTYAPLKRANVGPGSVVGVMGIGGLGHFGVIFAKAMGARVIAMSHSDVKKDVALELGADGYINTSDDETMKKYYKKLTHILCTGMSEDFTWEKYLPTLKPNGVFINVSGQGWKLPAIDPLFLLLLQVSIAGSAAGSPAEAKEMLKLASEKNLKPWYQTYPMTQINTALEDFRAGKPRFRFVLKN